MPTQRNDRGSSRASLHKMTCRAPKDSGALRLDEAIVAGFQGGAAWMTKTLARKLIMTGMVYVNGRRAPSPTQMLRGGELLDVYADKSLIAGARAQQLPEKLRILYEDEAIICFDKPAQLPTQPTVDSKRANLYDLARAQLSGDYLGMHHRLDRDTSGVILFTRKPEFNEHIAKQFSEHTCSKLYVALVHGHIPRQQGRLESFLGSLGPVGPKKMQKFGSVRSGGKKAITDFLVLASNKKYSLVEVRIKTGRTHQIRVHLSEMGHPVVGDTLYGSPVEYFNRHDRHMLHAHALTIEHPETRNPVRIESPVPTLFQSILESK